MLDHDAKAKFILALHKHSLQAFDSGGTVLGGQSAGGVNQNATNPNQGLIGGINNALGINNQFQAQSANVQAGTNAPQLNEAYSGVQGGLDNQQRFVNQASAQNGFGNQANVFAQQQALSNQLQMQANGQGPNVALNQLNQATGNNVAQQGALMAGQRGAGANVGLLARQAAQQGAGIQQQAAGQGATLQAQQQIAAQAALANQQAQQQAVAANQIAAQGQASTNLSSAQQNEQNILQGANTAYNNANVSQQGNINNVNSQTSAQNSQTAQKTVGGLLGGLSSLVGLAEGGEVDTGSFKGTSSNESSAPSIAAPATVSSPSSGGGSSQMDTIAKLAPLAMMAAAQGGVVPPALSTAAGGPQSFAGQWLNSNVSSGGAPSIASPSPYPVMQQEQSKFKDKSPAPKEETPYTDANYKMPEIGSEFSGNAPTLGVDTNLTGAPMAASSGPGLGLGSLMEAKGGRIQKALYDKGGKVNVTGPGQKAIKKDNSYANDKVPALLSEGEVVIPRSIMNHPNAPKKAAEFVAAVLAKKKAGKK